MMRTGNGIYYRLLFVITGLLIAVTLYGQSNFALTAKVTTSYVSSWENLEAVNDNYIPSNSGDKGPGAYGNWRGDAYYDTWNWVEYTFYSENKIDSVCVYWWTDGAGIQLPYEAYVEIWEGGDYVNVGAIGVEGDRFNTLALNRVSYKVRVNMKSTMATGILEFQVFGEPGDQPEIIPYIQVNSAERQQTAEILVNAGDHVTLGCDLVFLEGGTGSWTGPKGFSSANAIVSLEEIQALQTGIYRFVYTTATGFEFEKKYYILINNEGGSAFEWPSYTPTLDYNFRREYPQLETPTKNRQDCNSSLIAGEISSGWWTFIWGHKKKSEVTEAAIYPMLERFNEDFAYIRDTMGWPPDRRAKEGYRSAIYLYGSGLCSDNADSTDLGGWQSSVGGYPMVLASYYPVYSFDPDCPYDDKDFQTGAMIHEGIHSILADMPGCKEAHWFQEGGNTWLQQEMEASRSGDYSSMGSLNGCAFLAPFMPIECYSGWLQDNSFGGPGAQGVNKYDGGSQLCTWRNYLGGVQYGNTFPVFLGQTLGVGSIPWIWRYCEGFVLEGMADTLGNDQMRRLITEYRAKQALIDFGNWNGAIRKLLNSNFNLEVRSEWNPTWLNPEVWIGSPYARTTIDDDGVMTPEYRTTPGWSGANQIPLKVKGDSVSVDFRPIDDNLKCVLCYRDILGEPVYSEPVDSGICALKLNRPPANDVVIAVIANTDYEYKGEETRKAHFDYRIKIDKSQAEPAHTHKRWYAWDDNPDEDVPPTLPEISQPDTLPPTDLILELDPIYENVMWSGKKIGVFSTVDNSVSTGYTYSLVSGEGDDDNDKFRISSERLLTKAILDHEHSPYSIRVRTTNMNGGRLEKAFEVPVMAAGNSAGLNLMNKELVEFYPNPVNDQATVRLLNHESIKTIEVIDLSGAVKNVFRNVNADEYSFSKGNLATGMYYLKIDADETYFVKFVVE
ncbi:MAG: T9SS type A sorting domain-containing protein [Prolixibacteraceae bacterium]|nr:T9SS type A sorting domain-containing protein [Prolixibacteraceae bacterium]